MAVEQSGDECIHGMDTSWCSYCKPRAIPVIKVLRDAPKAARVQPAWKSMPRCTECGEEATTPPLCRRCRIRQQRSERPPVEARRSWAVGAPLREWQVEAIDSWWRHGQRGVIAAATGTGKTIAACAAIERLHEAHGDRLRVAVVVPTIVLAKQWARELRETLHLDPRRISQMHSDAQTDPDKSRPVLVAVLNSARNGLQPILTAWAKEGAHTLLIVDECHRAGAPANAKIFKSPFQSALGLSATPERPDRGDEEYIYPALGNQVYTYSLRRALDDGVLAPLTSLNLYVDFTATEQERWDDSTRLLAESLARLRSDYPTIDFTTQKAFTTIGQLADEGDRTAQRVVASISDRRSLLSECSARRRCVEEIFTWMLDSNPKALVFHETISSATASHQRLRQLGITAVIDHSALPSAERAQSTDAFRRTATRVMVAVRSLDEGVDVPEADVAVIVAGSRTRRQRIQRIGRVVRRQAGKSAIVISILTRGTPEESITGAQDAELLGEERVLHVRWPQKSLNDALSGARSSYQPDGMVSEVDALTFRALNSPVNR